MYKFKEFHKNGGVEVELEVRDLEGKEILLKGCEGQKKVLDILIQGVSGLEYRDIEVEYLDCYMGVGSRVLRQLGEVLKEVGAPAMWCMELYHQVFNPLKVLLSELEFKETRERIVSGLKVLVERLEQGGFLGEFIPLVVSEVEGEHCLIDPDGRILGEITKGYGNIGILDTNEFYTTEVLSVKDNKMKLLLGSGEKKKSDVLEFLEQSIIRTVGLEKVVQTLVGESVSLCDLIEDEADITWVSAKEGVDYVWSTLMFNKVVVDIRFQFIDKRMEECVLRGKWEELWDEATVKITGVEVYC